MKLRRIIIASLGALVVLLGMFLWSPDTGFCALAVWPFDFCDLALGGWPPGIYWVLLWLGKGMLAGVVFEGVNTVWRRVGGAPLLYWIVVRAVSIPRTAARILDNSPVATAAMACLVTCFLVYIQFNNSYEWHPSLAYVFWPLAVVFLVLYPSSLLAAAGRKSRGAQLIVIACGIYAGVLLTILFLLYTVILFSMVAGRN